jgi:hypothetical protein
VDESRTQGVIEYLQEEEAAKLPSDRILREQLGV